MRLSTKGRYAVMAMADLARNGRDGSGLARAVSLAEIATRQEISLSYLEQLFARLRKSGLVSSVRGPGGGYRLARGDLGQRNRPDFTALAASVFRQIGHRHHGVSSLGRQTHFAPSKIARFSGLLC